MYRLGGWHRLWLVFCVATLVFVSVGTWLLYPSENSISHNASFIHQLSPKAQAEIAPEGSQDASKVRMSNGHVILVRKDVMLRKSTPVLAEYEKILKREAHKQRIKLLECAAVIWLASCLVVYLLGWAVGWVYRGFKFHARSP